MSPEVGATFVEGREFMFTELPGQSDPLATHYGYADEHQDLPAQRRRQYDHGRSFDFYAANLQRLRAWRFNTIGNWSEPRLLERHEMPYVVPIHIYGNFTRVSSGSDWWGTVPDPFDPAFAVTVDELVAKAASTYRVDPILSAISSTTSWPGTSEMPRTCSCATLQWRRYGSPAKRFHRPARREISGC